MPAVQLEGFGAGGTSLNFKVVGGTTAPVNPKENTIWVNTDVKITSWHFGAEEPNVYDIPPRAPGDPHCLVSPKKLSDGDIINFTIPSDVVAVFEAIRIYDPVTDKQYCVRQGSGSAVTGWPAGAKVGFRISNVRHQVGDWVGHGTAFLMTWDSYYHEEGTVWITTGASSTVEFNALKKHGLKVYPISAKQYVGGAWVDKTAKSRQNGEWVNWAKYYIQNGKLVETLSGVLRTGQTVSMSQKDDYVEIKATSSYSGGYAYPSPINVTDYRKLVLYVDILSGVYDQYAVGPVLLTALDAANAAALSSNIIASEMANSVGTHILECNISEYDGIYYIGINVNCGDNSSKRPSAKIYDFYLA